MAYFLKIPQLVALLLFTVLIQVECKAWIFNFSSKVDSIQITYDEEQLRLPGEKFNIGIRSYMKNGKVKHTLFNERGTIPWFKYKVEVIGGNHFLGMVSVNPKLSPSIGKYIKIVVYPNKAPRLRKELLLPLNYETNIKILPDSKIIKAPGFSFWYKIEATFDNGITRIYSNKNKHNTSSDFMLFADGGKISRHRFSIWKDIELINKHTVSIEAVSVRNPACSHFMPIELDYRANYKLTLSGSSGFSGFSGSNGSNGSTGKNGTHGENGNDGRHGSHGPNIGVWADLYYDSLLQTNLLYVYAENFSRKKSFKYLINPDGGKLYVTSYGGDGGKGGSGGNGGDGGKGKDGKWKSKTVLKDSVEVTIKWQERGGNGGDGGHGGHGGYGGSGGNGGDIYLFFSNDAFPYCDVIVAESVRGRGGSGGSGGRAGSGGKGGSGDPKGNDGSSGSRGSSGSDGYNGYDGYIFYDETDDFFEYIPLVLNELEYEE